MNAPGSKPTLHDLLKQGVRGAVAQVHTSMPGVVVSYNRDTQLASVQPAIKAAYAHPDTGERTPYALPVIANVPVAFPQGGGFSMAWDLVAGDEVLLCFCERSTDEWKTHGGAGHETQDARRHDLQDAIALPQLRSPSSPIEADGVAAGAVVLRCDDLRLGSSAAAEYVALATLVDATFQALSTVFGAWTPVSGDGGLALKTALTTLIASGWPSSTAATKVKAE